MVSKPLTDNQELFCQEYRKDRNASRAYKAAYPNCRSGWNQHGARLMTNDNIKARIRGIIAELSAKAEWDVKESERRYKEAYDLALACKQPSAMVSAVQAVNKMYSLDIDKGYRDTDKPLTPQEQALYDRLAREANITLAKEQNETKTA